MGSPCDPVLVEQRGHVTLVTINRPEAHNAVDQDVWDSLGEAWAAADADPACRAIVLTGTGERTFCAGADLKAIMQGNFRRTTDERRDPWGFAGVVRHEISVPVIAAVNGDALGGGWEIVLACDLVVAAQGARFALPEVRHGLVAGGGGAFRLARQMPGPLASELLLTGRRITSEELVPFGMVNAVVPRADVLSRALQLAETIATQGPVAVRATKRMMRGINHGSVAADAEHWLRAEREVTVVMRSDDAREGPTAFAEKRPPRWTGR